MAKRPRKAKVRMGRPELADPLKILLNLRINRRVETAAEAYRQRHGLASIGTAVRQAAEATFKREGLLDQE